MAKLKDSSILQDIKNLQNELLSLRRCFSQESLDVWRDILRIVSVDAFGLYSRTQSMSTSEDKLENIRDLSVKFRVVENCIEILVGIENTSTDKQPGSFNPSDQARLLEILSKLLKACEDWEEDVRDELRRQILN